MHQLQPFYLLRLLGGLMYLTGAIMLAVNFVKTISGPATATAPAPAAAR